MWKGGLAYILTNPFNSILYVGVTSDLQDRVIKHKNKYYAKCFTARYHVDKLVYFTFYPTILEAIERKNKLKEEAERQWVKLIESINPDWLRLTAPAVDKSKPG